MPAITLKLYRLLAGHIKKVFQYSVYHSLYQEIYFFEAHLSVHTSSAFPLFATSPRRLWRTAGFPLQSGLAFGVYLFHHLFCTNCFLSSKNAFYLSFQMPQNPTSITARCFFINRNPKTVSKRH